MYQSINLDALSDMLDINLRCPEYLFHMKSYSSVTDCGTTHCLVGNYWEVYSFTKAAAYSTISLRVQDTIKLFGLSRREFGFLFNLHNVGRDGCKCAYHLSYKEALTRLAKFIIYKRRKKAMWADYEKARRTEGDNMFCEVSQSEIQELVLC